MRTLFMVGAVLAAVMALAGYGSLKIMDYRYSRSSEGMGVANIVATKAKMSAELQDHVDTLAKDGCDAKAKEFEELQAQGPSKDARDVRPLLLADLNLCVARGIMRGFVKDRLKDAGLWTILTAPAS